NFPHQVSSTLHPANKSSPRKSAPNSKDTSIPEPEEFHVSKASTSKQTQSCYSPPTLASISAFTAVPSQGLISPEKSPKRNSAKRQSHTHRRTFEEKQMMSLGRLCANYSIVHIFMFS